MKRTDRELQQQRGNRALPIVYGRDKHKCRYCGRKTVLVRRIPEKRRIGYLNGGNDFKFVRPNSGKNRVLPVASVDHVVPIAAGGQSYLSNLVLSCVECNKRRADEWLAALNEAEAPNAL